MILLPLEFDDPALRATFVRPGHNHTMTGTRCTPTDHEWNGGGVTDTGERFLICEVCAATSPPPTVEPGAQLVDLGELAEACDP